MFLYFVVVVDNAQNKRLLALCCIIRKGNIADIVYTPSNNYVGWYTGITVSFCMSRLCWKDIIKTVQSFATKLSMVEDCHESECRSPVALCPSVWLSLSVSVSLRLCLSVLCSFDSGNTDGTNSLKIRVDICLYMYDFLCLFRACLLLI